MLAGGVLLAFSACDGGNTKPDTDFAADATVDPGANLTSTDAEPADRDVATPAPGTDPVVTLDPLALAGPPRSGASVASAGDVLVHCSGNSVVMDGKPTPLPAACAAVAASGATVVAADIGGTWHDLSGATLDAGVPLGLTLAEGNVYAALGASGVMSVAATLDETPTTVAGPKDARDVVALGGGRLLVADGVAGALIVEPGAEPIAVPSPKPFAITTTAAALNDTTAVVAFAGYGLCAVDTQSGAILGTAKSPRMITDVAVGADGLVMTAAWTRTELIDFTDQTAPAPVATEELPAHAISLAWHADAFRVASTDALTTLTVDPTVMVPELHLDRRRVRVGVDAALGFAGVGLLLYNRGRADLHVMDMAVDDPRLTLPPFAGTGRPGVDLVITPGAVEFVELNVEGHDPATFELTFETNDPDNLSVSIPIEVNPTLPAIGEVAPDFYAPTVGGPFVKLSELVGQVPHVKFFNAY